MICSIVSQKGGVGKSTVARMLAVEFTKANWSVHVADLDPQQQTSSRWAADREEAGIQPSIETGVYSRPNVAIKAQSSYDLVIIDGAPHATRATREIAEYSDLVVIPTGYSNDDMRPALELAHELKLSGVPSKKIVFALMLVTDSTRDSEDSRNTITDWGFVALKGFIPLSQAYINAQNGGRCCTETRYKTLNEKADILSQSIIDKIMELSNDG